MENLKNGLWTKEEDHSTPMFCRNSCTADFTFHMFMFILPYSFYLHSTQTPSPSTCCISAHSDTPGNIADIFVTSVSVIRSALRPCLVLVLLLGRDSNICTQPQQPSSNTKHSAAGRHQFKVHTACSLDLDLARADPQIGVDQRCSDTMVVSKAPAAAAQVAADTRSLRPGPSDQPATSKKVLFSD